MSANIWITLGVAAAAFAAIAIPYGFHLKSEQGTERIVAEIRKAASQKAGPDQVAVFQQSNSVFFFQGAQGGVPLDVENVMGVLPALREVHSSTL